MTFHPVYLLMLSLFVPVVSPSQTRAQSGFPLSDESLRYAINWPSGLSLGEAQIRATRGAAGPKIPERWEFEMTIDAGIPGFQVMDRYRSISTGEFCSQQFEKHSARGKKKAQEKTVFDSSKGTALRQTVNGGKTDISVSLCAKDALTFLYALRQELQLGRMPPAQTVLFGAPYQVRLEFTGTQTLKISEVSVEADRIVTFLKGAATDLTFEIFFARDPQRTPLLVRVPLSMGIFSMELVR